MNKVDVEITPEPREEERRAILEALEEHPDALAPSLWRRAALGPGLPDDSDQAVAPPRHRRGATRA